MWIAEAAIPAALLLCGVAAAPSATGEASLEDVGSRFPPVVFVSRNAILGEDGAPEPGAIPGIGPRDRAARVGGRLLVREPDGGIRVLVDASSLFDVSDACVSWDGSRILFAGLSAPDSSWRIYEIGADGSGLRQVTRTDRAISLDQFGAVASRFVRYDDIDPCWLPDGRICFASTRYPLVSEPGDQLATNLFVANADGSGQRRITTERSGGEEPAIDPLTGRIVYTRWWINLDRPSNTARNGITLLDDQALTKDIANIWQTISVTPDGRGARLHAGDPRSRSGMNCYKPTLLPDGRVLALYGGNGSFAPSAGRTGVRLFSPGASVGSFVVGGGSDPLQPCAADPFPLPGGRILVSWSRSATSDFAIASCALDGSDLEVVVDFPGTHELDACVLSPSATPPVIADQIAGDTPELPPTEDPASFVRSGTFRFDCLNVFANAPVDAPIPDGPPITRDSRIRFFLNFQRRNPAGRDPSILFREARLSARGAVYEQGIPADLPFFGHLVDAQGSVIVGTTGIPAHVPGYGSGRRGGWAQCVGCHAGHSVMEIAHTFSGAEWFNASTSARVEATSEWGPVAGAPSPCPGRRVIDRRARNDSLEVAWVAAGTRGEAITLRWDLPIEVSRFVLYGIRPNPLAVTDVRVEECRILVYREGVLVGEVASTPPIEPDGTTVAIPPAVIDSMRIEIVKSRGRIVGEPRTGLAEVETIARLALVENAP